MQKKWLWGAVAILGICAVPCTGLLGSIYLSFPESQGQRILANPITGVETGGAYAWVIPSNTGVILVDAGMDPSAKALKDAIKGRTVHAVLITHGHSDHTNGLHTITNIPVYVGPGEAVLVKGEEQPTSWIHTIVGNFLGDAPTVASLTEVIDGQTFLVDGVRVRAAHIPGHTRGSVAWLINETLFTGDSLLGHPDHVAPVHWIFAEDYDQNVKSVSALVDLPFKYIADGHAGFHRDAPRKVRDLAGSSK